MRIREVQPTLHKEEGYSVTLGSGVFSGTSGTRVNQQVALWLLP